MFFNIDILKEHQMMEHGDDQPSTDVVLIQDHEAVQQEVNLEEEVESNAVEPQAINEHSSVWVKLANLLWPAKIVRKMGELT